MGKKPRFCEKLLSQERNLPTNPVSNFGKLAPTYKRNKSGTIPKQRYTSSVHSAVIASMSLARLVRGFCRKSQPTPTTLANNIPKSQLTGVVKLIWDAAIEVAIALKPNTHTQATTAFPLPQIAL